MFYPHRTSMRRHRPSRLRTDRTGRGPPSPHSTEGVLKTSAGITRSRDYLLLADFDSEPRPVFAGPRLKPPKWVRMSDRTLALDGLLACLIRTGIKGHPPRRHSSHITHDRNSSIPRLLFSPAARTRILAVWAGNLTQLTEQFAKDRVILNPQVYVSIDV